VVQRSGVAFHSFTMAATPHNGVNRIEHEIGALRFLRVKGRQASFIGKSIVLMDLGAGVSCRSPKLAMPGAPPLGSNNLRVREWQLIPSE